MTYFDLNRDVADSLKSYLTGLQFEHEICSDGDYFLIRIAITYNTLKISLNADKFDLKEFIEKNTITLDNKELRAIEYRGGHFNLRSESGLFIEFDSKHNEQIMSWIHQLFRLAYIESIHIYGTTQEEMDKNLEQLNEHLNKLHNSSKHDLPRSQP